MIPMPTMQVWARMVIIDSPESKWVKELEDDETISKFVPIDFNDEAAVFDKCLAAIKDIEKVRPSSCHLLATVIDAVMRISMMPPSVRSCRPYCERRGVGGT